MSHKLTGHFRMTWQWQKQQTRFDAGSHRFNQRTATTPAINYLYRMRRAVDAGSTQFCTTWMTVVFQIQYALLVDKEHGDQ